MKAATGGFRRMFTRVVLVVGMGLTVLALMVSPARRVPPRSSRAAITARPAEGSWVEALLDRVAVIVT